MKKEKIKSLFHNVVSNIIATFIIYIIIGVGAACAVIWASIKSIILKSDGYMIPFTYWIIFTIGLIIAIVCIVLCILDFVKRMKGTNLPKIQSDVRYESAKSELFFKNREEISCSREVKIEVVCEKLESIKKQFTWTGTRYKETVIEKSQGNYSLVDNHRQQSPHGYEVKFDSTKKRGAKLWYKTTTYVEDYNHDMQPFFSHTVKSQTDLLELRVTAPKGLLHNVMYVVCADSMGEIYISDPVQIEGQDVGNLQTYFCRIEKTNLLYNYRLYWEFS